MTKSIDLPDIHEVARRIISNLKSVSIDLEKVLLSTSDNTAIIRVYMTSQRVLKYFNAIKQAGATPQQIEPVMVEIYGMIDVQSETVKYEAMRDVLLPNLIAYIVSIEEKVLKNSLGDEKINYESLSTEDQAALIIEINKALAGF